MRHSTDLFVHEMTEPEVFTNVGDLNWWISVFVIRFPPLRHTTAFHWNTAPKKRTTSRGELCLLCWPRTWRRPVWVPISIPESAADATPVSIRSTSSTGPCWSTWNKAISICCTKPAKTKPRANWEPTELMYRASYSKRPGKSVIVTHLLRNCWARPSVYVPTTPSISC